MSSGDERFTPVHLIDGLQLSHIARILYTRWFTRNSRKPTKMGLNSTGIKLRGRDSWREDVLYKVGVGQTGGSRQVTAIH